MSELEIRIKERIGIYKDSPSLSVTYIDLAQTFEILLEIIEEKKKIGFTEKEKINEQRN